MIRSLLSIVMIVQVATCSFNCVLQAAEQRQSLELVSRCTCCDVDVPARDAVPADERDDCQDEVCFCNSAASPAAPCDLGLFLDSRAVWTAVELGRPETDALDSMNLAANWHPGDESGIGLRLAVRSLLL